MREDVGVGRDVRPVGEWAWRDAGGRVERESSIKAREESGGA